MRERKRKDMESGGWGSGKDPGVERGKTVIGMCFMGKIYFSFFKRKKDKIDVQILL